MNTKALTKGTRLLLIVSALALGLVIMFPIWRIELNAPQYPEGLALLIHANGIKGDVDIINGLNHYIGMRTLHDKDFIEFSILTYIIAFFSILMLITALLNKRSVLNIATILFVLFGIVAMIDFWRWEYDYGHHLDPNAAIKVPGMAYQPPLIGFKQLLNFGAYSIPDIGGWIFIGVGILLLFIQYIEWREAKNKVKVALTTVMTLPLLLLFSSCSSKPEQVVAGKDQCYFCKMQVTDVRFASVALTTKGKSYKFDDKHCLDDFIKSAMVDQKDIKGIYYVNYLNPAAFIEEKQAVLVTSEALHSPMGGNTVAVATVADKEKVLQQLETVK